MSKNLIQTIFFLPLALFITSQQSISSEEKNYIDGVLEEKEDTIFIDYENIEDIINNNQELKSLKEIIKSSSFNLTSKISKRYPSVDLQANGLPKYVAGKSYNSNLPTTKTSQFSANPSINFRWDLIDPLRSSEIKIARDNYTISKNNYIIKRKDLVQEAKKRYHKYQKSHQEIENKINALNLSKISLENAQSKLDAGIGTKFEVLEADAQLSRDQQNLSEKKIEHAVNKLSLKEILNIKKDVNIQTNQKVIGFWNHKLHKNINEGLVKSLSLKNIDLKKNINKSQARSYLDSSKPIIYLSNTFSSAFTKGDASSILLDSSEYGSAYTNTISLNFSWNIFNGGQNKNSFKSKDSEAKAEEYAYDNLKNILKFNINKAYLNLKLQEEKIQSSFKEISSTTESLRLSRLRYDVGISTLKDVLTRQKELSNAKSKKINAIYNYNLNLNELERLTFLEINKNCIKNNTITNKESICNILK